VSGPPELRLFMVEHDLRDLSLQRRSSAHLLSQVPCKLLAPRGHHPARTAARRRLRGTGSAVAAHPGTVLERQARPGTTACCGAGGVAGARKTSRPPVITVADERKPGPDDLGPRCPVIGGRPAGSAYGRPCRTSSVVSTTATTSRASHLRRQDETACSPGAGPNMDTTSRPCSDTAAATFPCGQAGRLTHAG
jgi:hypothetical protein